MPPNFCTRTKPTALCTETPRGVAEQSAVTVGAWTELTAVTPDGAADPAFAPVADAAPTPLVALTRTGDAELEAVVVGAFTELVAVTPVGLALAPPLADARKSHAIAAP